MCSSLDFIVSESKSTFLVITTCTMYIASSLARSSQLFKVTLLVLQYGRGPGDRVVVTCMLEAVRSVLVSVFLCLVPAKSIL